jgi:hypothetical protein
MLKELENGLLEYACYGHRMGTLGRPMRSQFKASKVQRNGLDSEGLWGHRWEIRIGGHTTKLYLSV